MSSSNRKMPRRDQSIASLENSLSIDRSQQLLDATEVSKSPQHEIEQQTVSMSWSLTGQTLCSATYNEMKFWSLTPEIGLKLNFTNPLSNFTLIDVKYLDQHLVGGKSKNKVRFWDTRENSCYQIFQTNSSSSQQQYLFETNKQLQYFTVGSPHKLKTFDLRNPTKYLSHLTSDTPIHDIEWIEQNNNILVTGGGMGNKGIIALYDKDSEKLEELELQASAIVNVGVDKQGRKLVSLGSENVMQLYALPDVLCESVGMIPDEEQTYGCEMSYNAEYITILQKKQLSIYTSQHLSQPPKIHQIKKYSTCRWHPSQNLLAYQSQDTNSLSLLNMDRTLKKTGRIGRS